MVSYYKNNSNEKFVTKLNLLFFDGSIDSSRAYHSNTIALRVTLLFVGLWWFSWTWVPVLFLKARPGPPIPSTVNKYTYSWKQVYYILYFVFHITFLCFVLFFFLYQNYHACHKHTYTHTHTHTHTNAWRTHYTYLT